MTSSRAMLRWARTRLAELPPIPSPWDIEQYAERVAEYRQRPIELIPRMMSRYASVATGLWIRRGDRDQVIYDNSGTKLHQDHVILHELAHMLCGHEGMSVPAGDAKEEGTRVLHRGAYDNPQELEAETLAYVIWQAAGLRLVPGRGPVTRLAGAFEHN